MSINYIVSFFRILMILITTHAIAIQPLLDFNDNDKVSIYNFDEEPNSKEENSTEEKLKDKKIDNQFIGSHLVNFVKINKKYNNLKELVNSDAYLEIQIPPPDFS